MALDQRPLSIGEILDRTATLYRRYFLPLVSITAPPAAALILLFGSFTLFFVTRLGATKADAANPFLILAIFGLFLLLGVPLLLGIMAVSLGASNHAVLCAHRGEPITIRGSYTYAFSRFWRLVWLLFLQALFAWVIPYIIFTVLVGVGAVAAVASSITTASAPGIVLIVLVVLGIIALVVTCVSLWIRFSLAFPAVVAEDRSAWQAIKRSISLSKGTRGRIFVMFLLVWILTVAVSMVLVAPVDIGIALFFRQSLTGAQPPTTFTIVLQIANLCIDFAVRTLVMPIYAISLVLFYFDQRTRNAGYDIVLLLARAGWDGLQPTPIAPPPEPSPAASPEPALNPVPPPEQSATLEPAAPQPDPEQHTDPEAAGA